MCAYIDIENIIIHNFIYDLHYGGAYVRINGALQNAHKELRNVSVGLFNRSELRHFVTFYEPSKAFSIILIILLYVYHPFDTMERVIDTNLFFLLVLNFKRWEILNGYFNR